jgi:Mn2+/Fe2+ NRAMP family transporter
MREILTINHKEWHMAKPKVNSSVVIAVQSTVIAVLVTAVIAFVGGIHYQKQHDAEVQSAVKASQTASTVKK